MRPCGRPYAYHSPLTPKAGPALRQALPEPPERVDWRPAVRERWQMWGNDLLGDCADAAAAAQILVWTANAQAARVLTTDQVEKNYSLTGGYIPGRADTDNGTVLVTLLDHWVEQGIQDSTGTPDVLTAYGYLDWRDRPSIKRSIALMGGIYVGAALPDSAVQNNDWKTLTGAPKNGHCFMGAGYDPENVFVVTWKEELLVPWEFFEKYVDESYTLLSRHNWIGVHGSAPNHVAIDALVADFQKLHA